MNKRVTVNKTLFSRQEQRNLQQAGPENFRPYHGQSTYQVTASPVTVSYSTIFLELASTCTTSSRTSNMLPYPNFSSGQSGQQQTHFTAKIWCEHHKSNLHSTDDCMVTTKERAKASIARAAQAKANANSPYAKPPPANPGTGFSSAKSGQVPVVCEHCEGFGHVGSACPALQRNATERVFHCANCLSLLRPDEYACQSCIAQANNLGRDHFIGRASPVFMGGILPTCVKCGSHGTVVDFGMDVVMTCSTWACATFSIRALAGCRCPILNKEGNLKWVKY